MTNTAPPESAAGSGDTRLVPSYTFEEFVVGPHNRFPHAASLAVSENLGKAYNPLFLYGPVGIGKTHLMQAVGHRVLLRDPKTRVLYVTAQHFMTEVIELLQAGRLQSLRERYRALDLLLVDDIHFLATSEATQEEFFHMFNDLHASGKQIIMTSDRPPKMLTTLEDRLRSRFEWGLIADIKFTNLETRVAILKKKESHLKGMSLGDDIRLYIASRLKSNIRELEGFLRRIQAYTQLYNEEISLDLVKEILKELLPPEEMGPEEGGTPPNSSSLNKGEAETSPKDSHGETDGFDLRPSHLEFQTPVSRAPAPPERTKPADQKPDETLSPPSHPKGEDSLSNQQPPPPKESTADHPTPPPRPPEPPILTTEKQADPPSPKMDSPEKVNRPMIFPTSPAGPPRPNSSPPASPPVPLPGGGPTPKIPPGSGYGSQSPMPRISIPASPPPEKNPSSVSGPTNPGQIPVVFFYPGGHDKELVQMKKKFEDIINKHKLKFVLHPALEVDYAQTASLAVETFVEKCQQAGVSIGVVLGPSPDATLQEGVFFSRLQEAFDQAQLSLQMVPWDELGKDYRFLNLALDITLIRIKQRK